MSGSRMVTTAPFRAAVGHTFSVSPTGAGSWFGSWVAPGGGWGNIFGRVGAIHSSGGQPASPMPYSDPDAAWSTGLTGLDTWTVSTVGAPAGAWARTGTATRLAMEATAAVMTCRCTLPPRVEC